MRICGVPGSPERYAVSRRIAAGSLFMTLDELGPVVLGTELPRTLDEKPLESVPYRDIMVLGGLAEELTGVRHDIDYSWGKPSWYREERRYSIRLPRQYRVRCIAQMGAWAARARDHLAEIEGLEVRADLKSIGRTENNSEDAGANVLHPLWFDDMPSANAGWVAREFDMLLDSPSSGIEHVRTVNILPADSRFWPEALQ